MRGFPEFYHFSSSTTSTVTYAFHDEATQPPPPLTKQIPIHSTKPPSNDTRSASAAATKIQAAYRARAIRLLYRTISAVDAAAGEIERRIQRQETVDAVRREEREKARVNEELMRLLLRLDAVPGFDPAVREARRKASRWIVGIQEVLDGICESRVEDWDWDGGGGEFGWDRTVAEMEERVCRERGGEEMEKFCAEYLGFRCFQRFLRE
ncbi:unnamed protein product [Linum tenue]|uniref:BAG domain-containing protein n=2 Tax=Linum tenue TaxID=586396 RepID=A0AAV0M219_9ROSI|nr:unnamed protein product [Linum tenue]